MINLKPVFAHAARWNNARYPRAYNALLSYELIIEELQEFYEAQSFVDHIDACCDLVFVALGMTWKLDLSEQEMNDSIAGALKLVAEFSQTNEAEPMVQLLNTMEKLHGPIEDSLLALDIAQLVIVVSVQQMYSMGFDHKEAYKALIAVCESNNTKAIVKIEPGAKYSPEGKGACYAPPTERLQKIIDGVTKRVG